MMRFQQLVFFGDDDVAKTVTERYLSVGCSNRAAASQPALWCVPFPGRLSHLLVHQQGAEELEVPEPDLDERITVPRLPAPGSPEVVRTPTQIRYTLCLLNSDGEIQPSELECATIATNTGQCQDYQHAIDVFAGALVVFRCTKTGALATPIRNVVGTVLYTANLH